MGVAAVGVAMFLLVAIFIYFALQTSSVTVLLEELVNYKPADVFTFVKNFSNVVDVSFNVLVVLL